MPVEAEGSARAQRALQGRHRNPQMVARHNAARNVRVSPGAAGEETGRIFPARGKSHQRLKRKAAPWETRASVAGNTLESGWIPQDVISAVSRTKQRMLKSAT